MRCDGRHRAEVVGGPGGGVERDHEVAVLEAGLLDRGRALERGTGGGGETRYGGGADVLGVAAGHRVHVDPGRDGEVDPALVTQPP